MVFGWEAEARRYPGCVEEFVEEIGGVGVCVPGERGAETGVAAYEEDEEVRRERVG